MSPTIWETWLSRRPYASLVQTSNSGQASSRAPPHLSSRAAFSEQAVPSRSTGNCLPTSGRRSPSSSWYPSLSTLAIGTLSRLVVDMTEAFVASKVTLRAQIISLSTSAVEQGRIPKAFDHSTALIGLPDEVVI
ncbi:hypothetical protein M440DRAFT_1431874, partial [Trichoderma longibrachiatum ATCC 18648]